jgi:HSP20 family protein
MLGRANGANPVHRLREEMDHLFDNIFGAATAGLTYARGYPALNVWEDDGNLYAEAEVPGLTMDNLEVFVVGDELTIKGERKQADSNATYHRRERGVGQFSRTLRLPMPIDADKVEASLKDGVLSVRMPKAEAARPRKIEVRTV